MTVQEIGRLLEEKEVILNGRLFAFAAKLLGRERGLQAGRYFFSKETSIVSALKRLSRGEVKLEKVTIPEGLTVNETAHRLKAGAAVDSVTFISLVNNSAFTRSLGVEAKSLEGYLFPETYNLRWGMPARKAIEHMVCRFHDTFNDDLASRARELSLSLHDVTTLASMIEKEARIPEERPIISAVYHNRLQKDMLLQCDPTVIYALGGNVSSVTYRDLEVDSPYNTYRYHGLPPGPICSPGKASILAALYPSDVDYLYFVATNDGRHHFSETYGEHLKARRLINKGRYE